MVKPPVYKKAKSLHVDLLPRISVESGLFEYQVKEVMRSIVRNIMTELANGNDIRVAGLGTFWLKKAKAQMAFDPFRHSFKKVDIRYLPKFRYSLRANDFIKKEAKSNLGDGSST